MKTLLVSMVVMGLLTALLLFPAFARADWNGDASGDVLAVNPINGQLLMYRGNGAGLWMTGNAEVIGGAGWNSFDALVSPGDFSGDGKPDLIARTPAGQLYLYYGNGVGTFLFGGASTLIGGAGWQTYNLLVSGGDFSGDGKPDLIGRTPAGQLIMYRGNGTGYWLNDGAQTLIGGAGWEVFDSIVMPGDFSGDGKPDLLARLPAGQLIMYRGNGAGYWLDDGAQTLVGAGFQIYDKLIAGGDFSGDRKPDVIARTPAGQLYMYRGNGAGGWITGNAELIGGAGWNAFSQMVLVGGNALKPLDPNLTTYPTSIAYGGSIDTAAEEAAVGQALATRSDYAALWAGLRPEDQSTMLGAEDPAFATWAARIDTAPPTAVSDISVDDAVNADRTADFSWTEGTDPDVGAVPGSQVDEFRSQYRYRRVDAAPNWSSWKLKHTRQVLKII